MNTVPSEIPRLPRLGSSSHKGAFGRVLILAGSRKYQGAAFLAAMGALKGGAGLVHVGFPGSLYDCYATKLREAILHPLPETPEGSLSLGGFSQILELAENMNCVAVGPGLSVSRSTTFLANRLFEELETVSVFDADGLNALVLRGCDLGKHKGVRIITPHTGEYRRLFPNAKTGDEEQQAALAGANELVIVHKSATPVVSNGEKIVKIGSGTAALATGGTGDVLTGLISALAMRFSSPFEAAVCATWLHGRSGALAGEELTRECVVASSIFDYLPRAFQELELGLALEE